MASKLGMRFACMAVLAAMWWTLPPRRACGQASWAIYVMNADGSDVKKISRDDDRYFGSPVFSHDGKRLAYDGWPKGRHPRDAHLFVQTLGEEKAHDIGAGNTPSYSPDDSQIAFMRGQDNPSGDKAGVWVMNTDGKNREWISEGMYPRWSPEGDKLAFDSTHEGFPSLYVYDTISLERTRILDRGYGEIIGASFSPDATQLVFIGCKNGTFSTTTNGEVAVVDVQPSAKPNVVFQGFVGYRPEWSPRGKKLLFRLQQGAMQKLQILDLETDGKPIPVPQQFGRHNSDATWSSDGKQIAFSSDRG